MSIHFSEEHNGEQQDVIFWIIRKFQTALSRQVAESVTIEEVAAKAAECLNLKSKWGGSKLPGIAVSRPKGTARKERPEQEGEKRRREGETLSGRRQKTEGETQRSENKPRFSQQKVRRFGNNGNGSLEGWEGCGGRTSGDRKVGEKGMSEGLGSREEGEGGEGTLSKGGGSGGRNTSGGRGVGKKVKVEKLCQRKVVEVVEVIRQDIRM